MRWSEDKRDRWQGRLETGAQGLRARKGGGRASSALYRLGSVFRCSAQRSAFQAKLVRKRTQLQLQRHRHVSRGWRTIFFAAPQHHSSFTVTRKGRSKPLSLLSFFSIFEGCAKYFEVFCSNIFFYFLKENFL